MPHDKAHKGDCAIPDHLKGVHHDLPPPCETCGGHGMVGRPLDDDPGARCEDCNGTGRTSPSGGEAVSGSNNLMTDTTSLSESEERNRDSVADLVRELRYRSESLKENSQDWDGMLWHIRGYYNTTANLIDRAADALSRLMAQGGLAAAPSASLEVVDALRPFAEVMRFLDRMQADDRTAELSDTTIHVTGNGSSGGITFKEHHFADAAKAIRRWDLLQTSAATGSPSNPVDDGAVEATESALAWLDNWAQHVGNCPDGQVCTCGLDAIRYELRAALEAAEPHP